MRYPASEKLEIIRLVEQSHLPVRRTLEKLGIQPARFYRWYDRLQTGGPEALADKASRPTRVWNRIPDAIRERIVQLALDEPELSPRELATRFTDTANYFVSEASVYRLLKAHDLITSPAYIVMQAADEFKDKTTAVTRRGSSISHACSAIMVPVTSRRIWLSGWMHRTWGTFAALPTIRRHRARSNAGIRRSRTASCWKTTTCLAILKPTSKSSSIITITDATTRA